MTDRKIEHRAQSAGEALDPAGTGEGNQLDLEAVQEIAEAVVAGTGRYSGTDAGHVVLRLLAVLRAQASALAEAKERCAKVADKWAATMQKCADDTAARPARDSRDDQDLTRMESQFRRRVELCASIAAEIRALTEPQHGNG